MQRLAKFDGAIKIIRFNWPYYAISFLTFALSIGVQFTSISPMLKYAMLGGGVIAFYFTVASILASHWIYDRSDLYRLTWVDTIGLNNQKNVANVHAGFDETSHLLRLRYSHVDTYDFYDPRENPENSIERARKASLNGNATQIKIGEQIKTSEAIFLILAAHEIREESSRVLFFQGLKQSLAPGGSIVLVEHLRNLANLLAFGHGFLHFLSDQTWRESFRKSNLETKNEFSITPFIRCYILQ